MVISLRTVYYLLWQCLSRKKTSIKICYLNPFVKIIRQFYLKIPIPRIILIKITNSMKKGGFFFELSKFYLQLVLSTLGICCFRNHLILLVEWLCFLGMPEKTKSHFGCREQECRDHHTHQHQVLLVLCYSYVMFK